MAEQSYGQWGAWEFIEILGEGSFGRVYKASRQLFGKTNYSAIKVIKIPQNESQINVERSSGASDKAIKEYFMEIVQEWQTEIEMLESIKSAPNVMVVEDYEIIEHPDLIQWEIYIRMELLTPFTKRVQMSPFKSSDALKLGTDLCRALEYCSIRNILHRDIKPENIFVSSFGDFKLGDFGIARQLEKTNSSLSKKGTYMYMAPEVYRGEQYDASVDIYSLGLVLYKLFNNNRLPFAPQDKELLGFNDREESLGRRIRGDQLPPPVNASDEISRIILKACAFSPSERYSNPSEMLKDIQNITLKPEMDKVLINITKTDTHLTEGIFEHKSQSKNQSKIENSSLIEEEKTRGIFQSTNKSIDKSFTNTEKEDKLFKNITPEVIPVIKSSKENIRKDLVELIEKESPTQLEKRKNKGLAWISALGVLLLVLTLFITQGFGFFSQGNQEVEIPNVVYTSQQEAVSQLEGLGLKVSIIEKEDASQPAGTVLEQSVIALNKVTKGSSVQLTVAKAIEKVSIPEVKGMDVGQAKTQLEGLGLIVTIRQTINDDKPLGEVLSQSVTSSTKVNKGTSIELETVIHSEKITVPDVIGKSEAEAKQILNDLGLEVKIVYIINDNQTAGVVFKQSATANSSVNVGALIELSVYAKSELIAVPAFSGKTLSAYKTEAEKLGFVITSSEAFSNTVAKGSIISVNPKVGTKVSKGSKIAVVVSKGKSVETVKIPAGIGSAYATFQTNATNAGLIVSKADKCSNTVANGLILSMNPSEGTTVNKGTTVNVVVSIGNCPWSDYVTSLPSGVSATTHDIESKTQYQFRDKETTTSTSSTLTGWTKYDETYVWSAWSAWSKTVVSATANREVSTKQVETKNYKTVYKYSRWVYKNSCDLNKIYYTYFEYKGSCYVSGSGFWKNYQQDNTPLPKTGKYVDGRPQFLGPATTTDWYYNETSEQVYVNSTLHTEYSFRDKIFTYHFYRWKSWSEWQDTLVTSSSNREVQTRTVYRYRLK